jgi:hypothetical protein
MSRVPASGTGKRPTIGASGAPSAAKSDELLASPSFRDKKLRAWSKHIACSASFDAAKSGNIVVVGRALMQKIRARANIIKKRKNCKIESQDFSSVSVNEFHS